ncbi:MAG TPA: hypothetical protein PKZ07_19925 [Sedimentisphaerales bacterium]|nr:hypothetical protein [Sedimentisphaerales bacterium]
MYDIARFKDDILNSRTASLLSNSVTDVQDAYQKGGVGRAVGKAIGANVGGAMLVPAAITDDVLNAASPVTNFAGEVGKGLLGIDGTPSSAPAVATPAVAAPPTALAAAAAKLPAVPAVPQPTVTASPTTAQGGYGMAQGGVIGQQTSVSGITKLTGGGFKSPMFTDDPARAMAQYQGGTVNTMPAAAIAGSAGPTPAVSAALQAAAARGDYQSIADYYQRNGGTFNGATAAQDRIAALEKTITAPNGNMSIGDMIAAKARNKLALGQIAALREQPRLDAQTAAQTAQAAAQTQGILAGIPLTQAKTQSEAADAKIKQQHAELTKQLADTDPADTAKSTELRSRLNQIVGKTSDQQDKYILADVDTGQVDAMGQPIFKKVPFNQRTGEYAGKEAVQGDRKAKADAITAQYQAGKLSREEASAQLAALGYKK